MYYLYIIRIIVDSPNRNSILFLKFERVLKHYTQRCMVICGHRSGVGGSCPTPEGSRGYRTGGWPDGVVRNENVIGERAQNGGFPMGTVPSRLRL